MLRYRSSLPYPNHDRSLARRPKEVDRGYSIQEATALSGGSLDEFIVEVGRKASWIIFTRERNNSVAALCKDGTPKLYDRQQLHQKANKYTSQSLVHVRQLSDRMEPIGAVTLNLA
jgi:hypothetical protein